MDPRPLGAAEVARRAWLCELHDRDDAVWADPDSWDSWDNGWTRPGDPLTWYEAFASETGVVAFPGFAVEVIREVVRTRPDMTDISWVGTGLIEDLEMNQPALVVLHVLRDANLERNDLFDVLTGVWPNILERIGIRDGLKDLLRRDQLDWLLARSQAERDLLPTPTRDRASRAPARSPRRRRG